jgi:histone H3/H4
VKWTGEQVQEFVQMSDEEILIVTSKVKKYVKEKAGMNTAGNVPAVISAKIRELIDQAIENAQNDKRKTLKDRDF